jgi:hypothetical protein
MQVHEVSETTTLLLPVLSRILLAILRLYLVLYFIVAISDFRLVGNGPFQNPSLTPHQEGVESKIQNSLEGNNMRLHIGLDSHDQSDPAVT